MTRYACDDPPPSQASQQGHKLSGDERPVRRRLAMTTRTADTMASGLIYLGLGRAAVLCMNLVTTSRLARVLDTGGFGSFSFSISYVAYFMIVVGLGFETFVTREIAFDRSRLRDLVDGMMCTRLVLAVGMAGALMGVTAFLHVAPVVWMLIMIQGINLFTSAISLTCVFQGLQRMRVVAIRELLGSLFNMIGVLLLVHGPGNLVLAAWVTAGTTILTNGSLLIRYAHEFGWPHLRLPRRPDLLLARKSLVFFWAMLMITITYNAHVVILGLTRSEVDVGLFAAGWKLFNFAIVVPNLIATLFLPRIASLTGRPAERERITHLYMRMIIVTAVPITVFGAALIPQILTVLFGAAYLPAVSTVAFLMANALVVSLNIGFGTPVIAVGRQKSFFQIVALGALTGVVINVILIPRLGPEGAGIGSLLDELVILGLFIRDDPAVSVSRTLETLLQCVLAVAPAGLAAHFVAGLPGLQDSAATALVLGGGTGTGLYLVLLRLLQVDVAGLVTELRGLK